MSEAASGEDVTKDDDGLTVSFSLLLIVVVSVSAVNLNVVETGIILVSAVSVVGVTVLFVTSTSTGLDMATIGGTVIINEKSVLLDVPVVEGLGLKILGNVIGILYVVVLFKLAGVVSIATDVCDSVSPVSLIPVVSVSFVADDESGSVVPVVFTLIAFLELFFPLKEMVFTDSCFSFSICSL